MNPLALAIAGMLAMLPAALMAEEVTLTSEVVPALSGCWDMRDTQADITRHAEDPFYFSSVTNCFDEDGSGQLVTRGAAFHGYRNDAGNWVNAGGDGWEELSTYRLVLDQMRIEDETRVKLCHFAIEADVLTLTDCAIDGDPDYPAIEDTYYDRASK